METVLIRKIMDLSVLREKKWLWLADNPDKYEHDWPEWLINGGTLDHVTGWCFMCEAAVQRQQEHAMRTNTYPITPHHCNHCPLWSADWCYCTHAHILEQWRLAKLCSEFTRRSEIARQIAELPWQGEKLYPIAVYEKDIIEDYVGWRLSRAVKKKKVQENAETIRQIKVLLKKLRKIKALLN